MEELLNVFTNEEVDYLSVILEIAIYLLSGIIGMVFRSFIGLKDDLLKDKKKRKEGNQAYACQYTDNNYNYYGIIHCRWFFSRTIQ